MQKLLKHEYFLLKATCLFWLIAKVMSYKLWLKARFFPIVPSFNFLNSVPNSVHLTLFLTSLFLISYSLFFTNKKALIALFFVEIASCLLDQNRWQPWQYQYVISILVIIINFNNSKKISTWFMVVLSATYFYSGLQKFNLGFLQIVWQKALLHGFLHSPTHINQNKYIFYGGFALPVLEIIYGLGLLFSASRKWIIYLLIIMHIFLLAAIGPWALNVNLIVWPWNIAMIAYLIYFLVPGHLNNIDFKILLSRKNVAVAIVWCLFPLLNFVGLWDYFFSFSLYSGRIPNVEICVEKNLPKELEYYFHLKPKPIKCNCENGVNIQVWGMKEILVPPLPQERVYEKVKLALDKKYPEMKATYYIYYLPKSEKNYRMIKD